jgi:hypothetical protein
MKSCVHPRIIDLKFSTWSLRSIAGYVKEKKIVKEGGIRHTPVQINKRICSRVEAFKVCSWQ